jgi:predicted nucleotidyltransferase
MKDRFSEYAQILEELKLVPATQLSTFVVGSMARGWNHQTSDVDLVVVSTEAFVDDRVFMLTVPLAPKVLPTVAFNRDDRRWDVKFWLDSQVDQVLEKVSWEAFDTDTRIRDRFNLDEVLLIERLMTCIPISGESWVLRRREQITASAFRSFMIVQALSVLDALVEAAVGQLSAGDIESAVLSAHEAFGCAVDALLAGQGEFGAQMKWRARRFRAVAPSLLSFDQYWAIQTMRGYNPADTEKWVHNVIDVCRTVAMEVDVR